MKRLVLYYEIFQTISALFRLIVERKDKDSVKVYAIIGIVGMVICVGLNF